MPSSTTIFRLLLCSSDTTKLQPLKQRLLAAGVKVDCATGADSARELLWKRHYDGIALDLLLADRDGISFAMELRQEHPRVPILVISTTPGGKQHNGDPDWLTDYTDHARLIFALKQAGQRSAGHPPCILHVEGDDKLASLVKNTIGKQTTLFRARSAREARIAMALRNYDLALIRTELPAQTHQWNGHSGFQPQTLCVTTAENDPFLIILNNLRRTQYVHEPAYC